MPGGFGWLLLGGGTFPVVLTAVFESFMAGSLFTVSLGFAVNAWRARETRPSRRLGRLRPSVADEAVRWLQHRS
jgi:hypothetical protein